MHLFRHLKSQIKICVWKGLHLKGPLSYCFSSIHHRSQIYTEPVSDWLKHQTDHFQTGFYRNGSGQKERESLFLKLSESLSTNDIPGSSSGGEDPGETRAGSQWSSEFPLVSQRGVFSSETRTDPPRRSQRRAELRGAHAVPADGGGGGSR